MVKAHMYTQTKTATQDSGCLVKNTAKAHTLTTKQAPN